MSQSAESDQIEFYRAAPPTVRIADPNGSLLQINRPGTDVPLVRIFFDGHMEYGEGYEPDEAAHAFWAAMVNVLPGYLSTPPANEGGGTTVVETCPGCRQRPCICTTISLPKAEKDYKCPTLCDPDCDALCHEGHQVSAKRRHDADECETRQGGYPEVALPPDGSVR